MIGLGMLLVIGVVVIMMIIACMCTSENGLMVLFILGFAILPCVFFGPLWFLGCVGLAIAWIIGVGFFSLLSKIQSTPVEVQVIRVDSTSDRRNRIVVKWVLVALAVMVFAVMGIVDHYSAPTPVTVGYRMEDGYKIVDCKVLPSWCVGITGNGAIKAGNIIYTNVPANQ